MLHKLILAAAVAVLSAGSVRAQVTDITSGRPEYSGSYFNLVPAYERSVSAEDMRQDNEIDRKYRESLAKIPNKKPSNDPWKSVRRAPTATPVDRHRVE